MKIKLFSILFVFFFLSPAPLSAQQDYQPDYHPDYLDAEPFSGKLALPFNQKDIDLYQRMINPFGIIRHARDRGHGHGGLDFPLKAGASIFAVADGVIAEIAPGSEGRPGKDIILLIGSGEPPDEGWIFIYEHVDLSPGIKLHTRVRKGQKIATVPENLISNHLQLCYWWQSYYQRSTCWVDHLESKSFENYFNNVLRRDQKFIDSWEWTSEEGSYAFKELQNRKKFPKGAQLCYPMGLDVRVPEE